MIGRWSWPALTLAMLALGAATASASGYRTRGFELPHGAADPWGTAVDSSGNLWFAAPGCDFEPACSASAGRGAIGELRLPSHRIRLFHLPRIPGNQPIFVAFDPRGKLWFTTPDNGRIGEFDPVRRRFVGQWLLTPGSGPWDLTFAGGRLWYTEHFGAAVGTFDPVTHKHRDFPTPSAGSEPYGIAATRGFIWFTENNDEVDRVAVLDTRRHDRIREYPIVAPVSGTPHMITIGPSGHPWWTEGFAGTIATLDPTRATPGTCDTASGTCLGVRRFSVPPAASCGLGSHTSGIVFDPARHVLWLDDALSSRVGSFDPVTATFQMSQLADCNAHPHDGLALGHAGDVWFDEEFANGLGELTP